MRLRVRILLDPNGLAYQERNDVLREGKKRPRRYPGKNLAGLVPALEAGGVVLRRELSMRVWFRRCTTPGSNTDPMASVSI